MGAKIIIARDRFGTCKYHLAFCFIRWLCTSYTLLATLSVVFIEFITVVIVRLG